jgi:hypothetical protein
VAQQINGKSNNLNHCLKNVIYKDLAARPAEIAVSEVVVVFDAGAAPCGNVGCRYAVLAR